MLLVLMTATAAISCNRSDNPGNPESKNAYNKTEQDLEPNPDCKGLPVAIRNEALGFVLGSCLFEALERADALGLKLEGEQSPNTPENIYPYVVGGYGGDFKFELPEHRFTLFMFNAEQVLFAEKATLMYKKRYKEAVAAFEELDKYLTRKYGEPEIGSFLKRWKTDQLHIELRFGIDLKSYSTITLSYFERTLSTKAIGWPEDTGSQ
ncbi:MAG: hypothetical protein IH874_03330 [Candidatus Dadabacteria bacterium]|nr:hypothetical protein [Candidatus Dadabacteria bacterium]